MDGFSNLSDVFKENNYIEELINLQLELPERFIKNFDGKQHDGICKEIDHILKDDDSDLLYWNK